VTFETVSGSTYELDTDAQRIRRLAGSHAPTARQGEDGEWRAYVTTSDLVVGAPLLIVWDVEGDHAKCTMTSTVTVIDEP
jgi:hypothetical protein